MHNYHVIYAIGKNFGIGIQPSIPWNIPDHIKYFHDITTNYRSKLSKKGEKINVVIMGRKTSQAIP